MNRTKEEIAKKQKGYPKLYTNYPHLLFLYFIN